MEAWTAVSFATPEYEEYVPRWEEMIQSLGGIPLVIRMRSTGNWARNTGLKPSAILEAWMKVTTPWFLYLDVDTLIRETPSIPEGPWDIGVTENKVLTHKNRISAADLVFRKTSGALKFLQHWQTRCRLRPGKDHDHLTHSINTFRVMKRASVQDITGAIAWVPNGLRPGSEELTRAEEDRLAGTPSPETSTVWFAIPSIRPEKEAMRILNRWRARGYKVAVQRDPGAGGLPVELCLEVPYIGYANAVNLLTKTILEQDPAARWIVTGGDDVLPDAKHDPEQIADECEKHFKGTLGIMQPTGDPHLVDKQGRCSAERVCISPWMGREWCERAYMGTGPLCGDYFHFYVDEELHVLAERQGILWHRKDLTQYHAWWSREGKPAPPHTVLAKQNWDHASKLFNRRKSDNFPGSELKPL